MAHPQMFDDGDPMLELVRRIALALPGAREKVSHGRPTFFTTRVHCYYGGARKVEGAWEQHPRCVLLHLPEEEAAALRERPHSFVPAYLGSSGWLGLDLHEDVDVTDLAELVEESYRTIAPRRLVAELEVGT